MLQQRIKLDAGAELPTRCVENGPVAAAFNGVLEVECREESTSCVHACARPKGGDH